MARLLRERDKTEVGNLIFLHVGCGNRRHEGFINSNKDEMDLSKPWFYENESIDGIVSMHVIQQLTWRELIVAFKEAYRVLKKGGVMRMGCPMVEIEEYDLDYILGWNNINLFSFDLLKKVLVDRIGFTKILRRTFRRSVLPELAKLDNRPRKGTMYIEVIK